MTQPIKLTIAVDTTVRVRDCLHSASVDSTLFINDIEVYAGSANLNVSDLALNRQPFKPNDPELINQFLLQTAEKLSADLDVPITYEWQE